jgi:hypothetical protein
VNAALNPRRNTMCQICLTGVLVDGARGDGFCESCPDVLVREGSCWFDGRGIVRVQVAFLDRHGTPYCVVQHRQGAPRLVSQGLMFREWEYKPDHVDNGRVG